MKRSKIDSLLGFAVKAGKILYGIDTLETTKLRYYLILLCHSTAENTRKKVIHIAELRHVPIVVSESNLQYAVGRKNCKVLAITDRQMSDAMCKYLEEGYHLFSSEDK